MKILYAAAALCYSAASLAASDAQTLHSACNSLGTATKRQECFEALDRLSKQRNDKEKPRSKSESNPKIETAQNEILSMLKDPESARFSDAAISPSTGAVCGVVRAKNSMGGYSSPKRFIVTSEKARIESEESWKIEINWQELCNDI
jgi:hypothetical protein